MKIIKDTIFVPPNHSINTQKLILSTNPTQIHAHSNYELNYIVSGSGKRIIGHNISDFSKGDLIFLPPHVPHCWYSLDTQTNEVSVAYVTHFNEKITSLDFSRIPELEKVVNLFRSIRKGIWFKGEKTEKAGNIIKKMANLRGIERYIELMKVFQLLIQIEDREYLIQPISHDNLFDRDHDIIDKVFKYIYNNIKTGISLKQAAELVFKEPANFCKYFKTKTNQTFMEYVTNVRIWMAAKLLVETKMQITEICYECGYNNLANFHHYFKLVMNKTPSEYRRAFIVQ